MLASDINLADAVHAHTNFPHIRIINPPAFCTQAARYFMLVWLEMKFQALGNT
jgi:hypothetical protein